MGEARSVPAPKGLERSGRGFWKQVTKRYALRPDELVLLESACRTIDRIEQLEAELVGQPMVTKGSMGQLREHPLLAETRQQRTLLRQTIGQLKLPDADGAVQVNQHREAGLSRWAQAHGKGA